MSLLSRITTLFLMATCIANATAADPRTISERRLLTDTDIGKVFVAEGLTSHSNFGKYKVLLSTNTNGLYAFETFDLVNGEPVGKFLVSHPAEPIYREVSVDPETMKKARVEIQKANARLRQLLLQQVEGKR